MFWDVRVPARIWLCVANWRADVVRFVIFRLHFYLLLDLFPIRGGMSESRWQMRCTSRLRLPDPMVIGVGAATIV